MVDLDACYFCGDIGETLRRHDVLPPAVAPDAERQRTVVLCHRCHRKLQTVVEPLVEALGERGSPTVSGDDAVGPSAGTADPAGRDPVADEYDADASAETPPAVDVETDVPTGSGPGDAVDATAGPSESGAGDAGDSDTEESPSTDPMRETGPGDGTGVAIPSPGREDADDESDERDATTSGSDASEDDEASGVGTTAGEETSDGDADGTGSSGVERPAGYHKTLRFLRNRNLPMARSEAEELVASAYGMDVSQCRRVIDVAVEEGVLAEEDGQIRRA